MAVPMRTTRITVEEYLGGDYERGTWLVDGEVVVVDPTFWHQEVAARILVALSGWARAEPGRGRVGFGGNWVLAAGNVYKPDVWWLAEERLSALAGLRSDVPPDLAVEVRSPYTWYIDIGRKRDVYEAAGVAELWLVDSPARVVWVNRRSRPDSPTFDDQSELFEGDTLVSPQFEGFSLPLAELFAQ